MAAPHRPSAAHVRAPAFALLALALLSCAWALPAPPATPDPGTIPLPSSATLALAIPSEVPLSFEATLSHTAAFAYTCTIRLSDGQEAAGILVGPNQSVRTALLSRSPGAHSANASCVSGQGGPQLSANASFTVSALPQLALSVPAIAGNAFNATLWHTGAGTQTCTIGIDVGTPQGAVSNPFPLEQGHVRDITFTDVPLGAHVISSDCTGPAGQLSAAANITVGWLVCASSAQCPQGQACAANGTCVAGAQQAAVTFTSSPAVNGQNVSVTYMHVGNATRLCRLTIDESGWPAGDPRWNDTQHARYATLAPSTSRTEAFTGLGVGSHIAHARCTLPDGTDPKEAFAQFSVSAVQQVDTGGVRVTLISPLETAQDRINVTFVHNATGPGSCNITIDGTVRSTREVAPYASSTLLHDASRGMHAVRVSCAGTAGMQGTGWLAQASRDVNVTDAPAAPTPALSVREGSALDEDEAFTLAGTGFPALAQVRVSLAGGGDIVRNTTLAGSNGSFTLAYAGLAAGSYAISAWDLDDDTVRAAITLTVIPPYRPPQGDDQGGSPSAPVIGPSSPRADAPDPDTLYGGVDTTVGSGPDAYPDPYSGPASEPEPRGSIVPEDELPQEIDAGWALGWWVWLLIPLVLVGGAVGWLAHNGALDFTSLDGFMSSVRSLRDGGAPALKKMPSTGVTGGSTMGSGLRGGWQPGGGASSATLRSFIARERSKGFDDLTIRNALLRKGWDKDDVDSVFDDLYEAQKLSSEE